jgi:hypothetical protein
MKPALILCAIVVLLVAWIFRYDFPTHHEIRGTGGAGIKEPIMLDRWTGNTYSYSSGEWRKIKVAEPEKIVWDKEPQAK